jgi:hypothetical protein
VHRSCIIGRRFTTKVIRAAGPLLFLTTAFTHVSE